MFFTAPFTVSFLFFHLSNLDSDPNSRDLTYYSKMKDIGNLITCINWSPGAIGEYRIDRIKKGLLKQN